MRVMMFVRRDPSIEMPPEDRASMSEQVREWVAELERRGIRLHGAVFEPPEAALTGDLELDDYLQLQTVV